MPPLLYPDHGMISKPVDDGHQYTLQKIEDHFHVHGHGLLEMLPTPNIFIIGPQAQFVPGLLPYA